MALAIKVLRKIIRIFFYRFRFFRLGNILGLYTPRIVTKLDGGLGSQMWQFALGYSVAKKCGLPLTFETRFFSKNGKDCNGIPNRRLLLFDTFPLIRKNYNNLEESSSHYLYLFEDNTKRSTYDFNETLFQLGRPMFLSQYYANIRYIQDFREELEHFFEYTPLLNAQEIELATEIKQNESCMLHIRKGDFVGLCLDVCTDNYYISAIRKMASMVSNCVFYVFSNDENYFSKYIFPHCSEFNFRIIRGRSEENPCVDFFLMKLCKHAIISNSGFSWMAAWLKNESAKVIMPERWNNDSRRKKSSENAFYVNGWIKMPVE